ncbi:MAG: hypothetical protein KHX03_05335 [Clostridium sp.]|nr:hypothetical protein [Clostridium sp.]
MITNTFVHLISKNGFQNLIQNTTAQVSIETGLKAAGRPAFTLADTHVDKETRKYSAVKELLYQVLCLGIYLAVIPVTFKKGGFAAFKKICAKVDKHPELLKSLINPKNKEQALSCSIDMFKNEKGLLALHKLGHLSPEKRVDSNNPMAKKLLETLEKNIDLKKAPADFMQKVMKEHQSSDFFKQFYIAKGGIEMSSIVGSVVGLTVLAPELSHLILHPVMKALHMDAPKAAKEEKTQNIDKQA